MQTISWGQSAGEAEILPDPCGRGALHGSEVYLRGAGTRNDLALEGFLVIKKKKMYIVSVFKCGLGVEPHLGLLHLSYLLSLSLSHTHTHINLKFEQIST